MQGGALLIALWAAGQAGSPAPSSTPSSASSHASALEVQVAGVVAGRPAFVSPPATALKIYAERCATCHGARGAGDGPAAAGMLKKPRRFSDAVWQDSVDDAHIQKAILEGGFSVKKSTAMPPHPDLRDQAAGLVLVVRSFRSPTGTIAADLNAPDGKAVAHASADLDARGAARVKLTEVKPGPYTLIVQASGSTSPVCALELNVAPGQPAVRCEPAPMTPAASPDPSSTAELKPPPTP